MSSVYEYHKRSLWRHSRFYFAQMPYWALRIDKQRKEGLKMKVKVTRRKNGNQHLRSPSSGAGLKLTYTARSNRQPYPAAGKRHVVPRRAKRGA